MCKNEVRGIGDRSNRRLKQLGGEGGAVSELVTIECAKGRDGETVAKLSLKLAQTG
jgi:hypothetical protein